jgi:hypothetical protein
MIERKIFRHDEPIMEAWERFRNTPEWAKIMQDSGNAGATAAWRAFLYLFDVWMISKGGE